ncbi:MULTISPECIES: Tim44/TimA family putative adaptor protein [unclassified Beijerinckia]|uniref:Tim44/TimA family putative adaptor protein n=1 Tax=unclassified Beijerinckia TaxID=2638183 RepID=UPI000898F745|nr:MULTISPECIES: Tim44/TimA family putative adaptor protein [unclassified Beijerinckia]MDH7797991.1 putative lipid-binding transport protein (Tim44 family) [Beijerinckia sp. GAS462]SED05260.1 Predicted lipid-binding transport protein, Tim44 family [Beijerinckia sp. 28-YEA-48]
MQDSFDVTTIVFALLAIFVVWKLRSVLGTRPGPEKPRPERSPAPNGAAPGRNGNDGVVVRLPGAANDAGAPTTAAVAESRDRWTDVAEPGSKVWLGLDQIVAVDPSFDGKGFITGAKSAYEMIITAFASGDRQALRGLLAKEVFDSFAQAITDREARGEKVETTFVSIDKAQMTDAILRGKVAQITMRFVSKLITATRDRNGTVIDGDAEHVSDLVDVWTFERDTSARDPNWRLVIVADGDR